MEHRIYVWWRGVQIASSCVPAQYVTSLKKTQTGIHALSYTTEEDIASSSDVVCLALWTHKGLDRNAASGFGRCLVKTISRPRGTLGTLLLALCVL